MVGFVSWVLANLVVGGGGLQIVVCVGMRNESPCFR